MSKVDLVALNEKMNEPHVFVLGEVLEWKPGLKNKRSDGPFVVCEVLDPPITSTTTEPGSAYFREPLDIVLGHVDSDQDFVLFHYDSRRMQLAD
ncbi:MAG: hypothetical protein M3H12_04740 [Chromatiales bacterium]